MNSLPPSRSAPPTPAPKMAAAPAVPAGTTGAPPTASPTDKPTEAPVDAPVDAPDDAAPVEDETPPQFTEPTDTTEDPVVETTANGGGVAIPLLSVLGVVGIASLVVARRAYLKNKDDAESTSSDSDQS
mmetsp:Transcript_1945/g.4518  ORF Transcript_1945/g.4518 Transcript_1945/m.4518 type:complete len:129 (-) Transcript_1945:33-419(-)